MNAWTPFEYGTFAAVTSTEEYDTLIQQTPNIDNLQILFAQCNTQRIISITVVIPQYPKKLVNLQVNKACRFQSRSVFVDFINIKTGERMGNNYPFTTIYLDCDFKTELLFLVCSDITMHASNTNNDLYNRIITYYAIAENVECS